MMFESDRTGLDRAYVGVGVGPEDGAVTALKWALDRAGDDWGKVNLRVPSKAELHDSSVLTDMQRHGVNVTGERRGGSGRVVHGPLIAYYPDLKSLAAVEETRQATAIVVVGLCDSLRPWVSAFAPEHLAGEAVVPAEPVVVDPVVWEAMKTFTNSINSSTGLSDSRDKSRVIDGLQKLRRAKHHFDPDELMAGALRLNWRATAAIELHTLAGEINAGKAKRVTHGTYREDIVTMWEEDARTADPLRRELRQPQSKGT